MTFGSVLWWWVVIGSLLAIGTNLWMARVDYNLFAYDASTSNSRTRWGWAGRAATRIGFCGGWFIILKLVYGMRDPKTGLLVRQIGVTGDSVWYAVFLSVAIVGTVVTLVFLHPAERRVLWRRKETHMAMIKRGWWPLKVDPTKAAAMLTAVGGFGSAVVFALQSKTAAAWEGAATSALSLLLLLGLVRPNATPSSDPRDVDGAPLFRLDEGGHPRNPRGSSK